ncbi:unnamed protein product [Mycena citricolor]|uniref:Copper-fist domain-containing protein n=1 Tax=Mycena citricolor TaxID=2018698 RepID=A0AAD2HBH2_9AGAR|nr:unnamed protein product [Mycena citricolor]CAK5271530.1 unnamed protein product [Mycena citricolor]
MVLISSKKYACETCIKGHRSSACKHTDRPLFEIKKKGRPVTQCEHCRELRKTKQVHVKCICESKEPPSPTSSCSAPKKKGTPVLPAHPAFPNGVPDFVVAASTGSASDSEQGGSAPSVPGCNCKAGTGEGCQCCTPRKRPGRRRSSPAAPSHLTLSVAQSPNPTLPSLHTRDIIKASPPATPSPIPPPAPNPGHSRSASHHILARIAELRPVLPRMSARDAALQAQGGGQHDLFHGHGHSHGHGEHFSPYGRAYEHAFNSAESSAAGSSFYRLQDAAQSNESLMSSGSHLSVSSHPRTRSPLETGGRSPTFKNPKAPRRASFDVHGSYKHFGAAHEREQNASADNVWQIPPSLSRTNAPYPRSEGAVPSYEDYALSDASGGFPSSAELIQTCTCGDGCACPGCEVHPQSATSDATEHRCADASCAGSCLNCTLMAMPDFSSHFGLGGDSPMPLSFENNGTTFLDEEAMRLGLDGIDNATDLGLLATLNDPLSSSLSSYGQIDEWIREVEALPIGPLAYPGVAGVPPFEGLDFGAEVAVQMFDAERGQDQVMHGLSGSAVTDSHAPSSFLAVPGPDSHHRSRSSSSSSSEMSSGVFAVEGLNLDRREIPSPIPSPIDMASSPNFKLDEAMFSLPTPSMFLAYADDSMFF